MKVLVLGGTGAMGVPLVDFMNERADIESISVTTRQSLCSEKSKLRYIHGNARDNDFLNRLLAEKYDVVVDF